MGSVSFFSVYRICFFFRIFVLWELVRSSLCVFVGGFFLSSLFVYFLALNFVVLFLGWVDSCIRFGIV